MFGSLATWVPSFFLLTLAMKFWMEPKGYRLRSAIWKLVLAAVTLAAIFFSYGSLKGTAPCVSAIVVLMSLKLLDRPTPRQSSLIVTIAEMIGLAGLFPSHGFA